ncbi:MAG: Nramp family divalent metal transporter [Planctomycetaceae bacterium]|nr:Nramp family divalent metal transporter [Planctomycetaceae bacterium]
MSGDQQPYRPSKEPATNRSSEDPYALTTGAIADPPVSLWQALRKIGPGIVLAGSIVGSGELILTTSLGAEWGFVFLWLILFSCVIKVFVQIELGRYAISSGQPTLTALDSLPGPRLGAHWLVWWWFGMLLVTVFQLGAMVGSVGQALNMAFPAVSSAIASGLAAISSPLGAAVAQRPEHPWAVLTALAAVLLLLSGGYKRLEWITTILVAGVTLVTVICVGMLAGTDFPVRASDIADGFSLKVLALPAAAIAAAFSAFGITGVGASELYSYPYWCLEKGYARSTGPQSKDPAWAERARGWMRVMTLDAWVSCAVFTVATVAFYVLGATVLHRQDLHPKGKEMIQTLSEMYVPAFGEWTKLFFLIGVWAVLFKTLYVASAGHARLSTDFLGLTGLVKYDEPTKRPRWINRFCVFFPTLALVLYFAWRDPKIMVTIGGYAQAVTLPIISGAALYLRYFRTDKRLAPSWVSDLLLWIAFLSITAFSCYAVVKDVLPAVRT